MITWKYDSSIKIYLKPGPTDMRKSINGLVAIISNFMKLDPFSGYLFLFVNHKRDLMKLVYWDKNGFALWYKRLEKDKFPWPITEETTMELSIEELDWLLSGIDFFHKHKEVKYTISA